MRHFYLILAIMATTILCGCDPKETDFSGKDVFAGFTYENPSRNTIVFHDKSRGEKVYYDFGDDDYEYHDPKDKFIHVYTQSGEYKIIVIAYEKGYKTSFGGFVGDGKEFRTEVTIQVE